jgi:hypothetical protein
VSSKKHGPGAVVVGRHSFVHETSAELNWMFPFELTFAVVYGCP